MLPMQETKAESPVFAGIDVGSLTAKCVLISKNGMHAYAVMDTGAKPDKAGGTVFSKGLDKAGSDRAEIRPAASKWLTKKDL